MSKTTSTFKRYEKKFMLNNDQFLSISKKLERYMKPNRFDKYTICNIYYDTDTYEIIRRSIDKPVFKEKLRLRSYGTPERDDQVFFELKKKFNREVFKRRVSLSAEEFDNYLKCGSYPEGAKQVMDEIEYFKSLYNPHPAIFIAYERTALVGKEDSSLRITFDENIRFRNDDLSLSKGDYGTQILPEGQYLMEVKINEAMPIWLSRMLNEEQIFPISFSKYGYCYQNFMGFNVSKTNDDNQPAA